MNDFKVHPRLAVGVLLLCLLGIAALFIHERRQRVLSPISAEMTANLEQVIIAPFSLKNADSDEVIQFLNRCLARSPQALPIQFARWPLTSRPIGFHLRRKNPMIAKPGAVEKTLTLRFEQEIKLSVLLQYVAGLLDCTFGQRGGTLYLTDGVGEFGPIIKRTYPNLTVWMGALTDHGKKTVEEALADTGIQFFEGTSAALTPNGDLVVRNLQDQIDLLEAANAQP